MQEEVTSYKVYVKLDSRNVIIDLNSDLFLQDTTGWVYLDAGLETRYARAQVEYLEKGLVDSLYRCNYKLVEGAAVELTEAEKAELYPLPKSEPSEIETLQQENHLLKAQVKALTEQGEFQDELIAEIATVVYA